MADLTNVNDSDPVELTGRRIHDSNYVLNELKRILLGTTDAFDRLSPVSGFKNNLDLASHYNFSPERLRLFVNGSRAFPQYNAVSQFADNPDHWLLSPAAGDTVRIESAENGTYVVNYTLQASWAFQLNQSLVSGDVFRFGPRTTDDGWYIEQRGADHTDTQVDILELSNGTSNTLESNVEIPQPFTGWFRWEAVFAWYSVLNQIWTATYAEDDDTIINDLFARTSNPGNRGPETGNLNLYIEIEAGNSTTDLQLEVGSMGMVTIGDPVSLQRDKPQYESVTLTGTANAWEPVKALRIDPTNPNVNAQLTELTLLNYGSNADCEMLVVSVDASKTDATGFGVPEYHHDFNSALQTTENITEVPNENGTQEDLGAGTKPGGFTLASAVQLDGGNRSGTSATQNQNRQEKKSVLNSDVVVFLARSGTVGGTLDFIWDADQNW